MGKNENEMIRSISSGDEESARKSLAAALREKVLKRLREHQEG